MNAFRFGASTLILTSLVACGQPQAMLLNQPGAQLQNRPSTVRVGAKWVLKERSAHIPGEVVVQVKANQGFSTQSLRAFSAAGSRPKQRLRVQNQEFMLMNVPQQQDINQVLQQLRQDPAVQYADYNPRYMALQNYPQAPRPMGYGTMPRVGLFNTGTPAVGSGTAPNSAPGALNDAFAPLQWSLNKVGIPNAWNIGGQGRAEVLVAVIDSGVDYQHPDLKGQIVNGKDFMPDTVSGPNGEGSPDAVGNDPLDQMGHGTHVAGVIAALSNNRTGIAGIAPGVKVLNIKTLNRDGWGSAFAVAQGITSAVDQGARIINLSLGSSDGSKPIELAIQYAQSKGALIIAASGNAFTKTFFPARYPGVLAVGATNQDDWLADFSNHDERINVVAPGVDIMSTTPTYTTNTMLQQKIDSFYSVMSGTSMAAPMVSAQAALLLSRNPNLTAQQLQEIIQKTARKVGDHRIFGHGRIQIDASLDYLASQQPPTTAPPAAGDPAQINAQRFVYRR
ncbi:MAG: peptidase S8 [Candidatus Sericytochromatia bacterium]|nr:peptidase S8 [Candidatus Sericytochromatia bacterium]